MGKVKYNGLTLPELPEWDKEAYPYSFLFFEAYGGETVYDTYPGTTTLIVADKLGYLDNPRGITDMVTDGDYYVYTLGGNDLPSTDDWETHPVPISYIRWAIDVNTGAWALFDSGEKSQIHAGPKTAYPAKFAWTNTTLYDADGNVVLEASNPVPLCDLKSWLTGFALGLSGKPLPLSTGKTLVGYSYNGTVLPQLPEWDREMYPYATIGKNSGMTVWGLLVATQPFKRYEDGSLYTSGYINGMTFTAPEGGVEWEKGAESESLIVSWNNALWVNYDLYTSTTSGQTLYLSTSEPVPVYE